MKVEAFFFVLVLLTFAAVLGQESVTRKTFELSPFSDQYVPYTYTDLTQGGASEIETAARRPLSWTCALKPKFEYPYCAYGMQLVLASNGKGVSFSGFKEIGVHLNYTGKADRLKLVVKTKTPPHLRAKVGEDTVSRVADIEVRPGKNDIHLRVSDLHPEGWWVASKNLTPDEAAFALDEVVAVDVMANSQTPRAFGVSVESLTFRGAHLSTSQWYLVILGAWLIVAGGFLVYRFLDIRRRYEARQRRLAEEAEILASARSAADAANAAKSQFLANMSHELRTPLNAILGYAQLLGKAPLGETHRAAVRTIHQSGEHLLALITDILDIAKVEAGKVDLLPAPMSLRMCIADVAAMTRLRAEDKGLRFIVHVADNVPDNLIADSRRLRQVLLNLIGNAVKFTPAGEVALLVSREGTCTEHIGLRFDVSDTGLGIAPEQLERIFQPFEQAGNAVDRSGGTGLGLSITQRIVDMMRGQLSVTSTLGGGSRFSVVLSLTESGREERIEHAPTRANGTGRKILSVDGNATKQHLMRVELEARGYQFIHAEDSSHAIRLAADEAPDLILLDVKMAGAGGIGSIKVLRREPLTSTMPVIALTTSPSAEVRERAKNAGADLVFSKPVDFDRLHEGIISLLEGRSPTADSLEVVIAPPEEQMQRLLTMARAGNLRAIRSEMATLRQHSPEYSVFAEKLDALAANYQSPAVLRLIETHFDVRAAA